MKILRQEVFLDSQEVRVWTDASRHPVDVPLSVGQSYSDRHNQSLAVRGYVEVVLSLRRQMRLFQDRRHDHFKGFRA